MNKYIFLLTMMTLCCFWGCDSPVKTTETHNNLVELGTVKINIPDRLQSALEQNIQSSRALGLVSSAEITIRDNLGQVVSLWENNDSLDIEYGEMTIQLPAGTGYTALVDIYNHEYDEENPSLSGISDPFDITAGSSTYIELSPIPNSPIPLAYNTITTLSGRPTRYYRALDSFEVNQGIEYWYEFTPESTNLTNFLFSNIVEEGDNFHIFDMELYDSSGDSVFLYRGFSSGNPFNIPALEETPPALVVKDKQYYLFIVPASTDVNLEELSFNIEMVSQDLPSPLSITAGTPVTSEIDGNQCVSYVFTPAQSASYEISTGYFYGTVLLRYDDGEIIQYELDPQIDMSFTISETETRDIEIILYNREYYSQEITLELNFFITIF